MSVSMMERVAEAARVLAENGPAEEGRSFRGFRQHTEQLTDRLISAMFPPYAAASLSRESALAGKAAAEYIRSGAAGAETIQVTDGDGVRGTVPQMIHRNASADIDLMFRPAGVYRNSAAVVRCGGEEILRKKAMIYTPGEMAVLTLKAELLQRLPDSVLTVSIERTE